MAPMKEVDGAKMANESARIYRCLSSNKQRCASKWPKHECTYLVH